MRYGFALPNAGPAGDPASLGELAHVAEAAGWDGVFVEDYLIYQSKLGTPTFDPWVCLAAMAMRTERVRLGTAVTPLARRRPWQVASETVALDHLARGRLILGVGLGEAADVNFTRFGEGRDMPRRARMLDEALQVLVGLWSGEPFTFEGEFYQLTEAVMQPGPYRRPRIPIWIGGGWPLKGPAERAARWDGSCMYRHPAEGSWVDWTPEEIRALREFVAARRVTAEGYEIAIGGRERDADEQKERAHIQALAEAGATWWIEWIPPGELAEVQAAIARGPLRPA
jgi:alkanesulfonate monooxygenase SsuD/methylene tetrahydromethanopterin reductase-like flavin-dependent oxidoreductase (luciferase family)